MILTSALLTAAAAHAARDIKRAHDAVIQAALPGQPLRTVLWAQPTPRTLLIRHDQPITALDLPPGWAEDVTCAPQWLPGQGQRIEWAVTVDANQRAESHQQAERRRAASPGRARRGTRVRAADRMLELVTSQLGGAGLTILGAAAGQVEHRVGRRRDGRLMHTNPVRLHGEALVEDPAPFTALILSGVGRSRSFGCGLLLARPARGAGC